ncbi:MAG: DNA-binding response regulator [Nocardioides sp.]|nr:DNA-binding response regulator [Nocardioides sp.]
MTTSAFEEPVPPGLRALVVDDEKPARDELAYLLDRDPRVADVRTCGSATEGLKVLRETTVDCVFLDVHMPGLSGLELADVLSRFKQPPPVVFVTAHDGHAVEAFDLRAVDYVLKPVRAERLAEAVRRVLEAIGRVPAPEAEPAAPADVQIPVELGGVTRFVDRSTVTHVEAQGDYARLHTADGSHLIRVPLSTLEEEWADAGFVRIHRSLLVATGHVTEVRMDGGRCTVRVGTAPGTELGVSRRNTRELRERLLRRSGS